MQPDDSRREPGARARVRRRTVGGHAATVRGPTLTPELPAREILADHGYSTAVREAGVVGAGGAGFPTHVKLDAQVEFVLANGAECEPLLHKDAEL